MLINFRGGLAFTPTAQWVFRESGNMISFNASGAGVGICFIDGVNDYLVSLRGSLDNVVTASVGESVYARFIESTATVEFFASSKQIHIGDNEPDGSWFWFKPSHNMTYEKSANVWSKVIVIKIAVVSAGGVYGVATGSQVGISNTSMRNVGSVIHGHDGYPIRTGYGLLTDTSAIVIGGGSNGVSAVVGDGGLVVRAQSNIVRHFPISLVGDRVVKLAIGGSNDVCIGLALSDATAGGFLGVRTQGTIQGDFQFGDENINRTVFLGTGGGLSLQRPTHGICQVVGRVWGDNVINVDIGTPVRLSN